MASRNSNMARFRLRGRRACGLVTSSDFNHACYPLTDSLAQRTPHEGNAQPHWQNTTSFGRIHSVGGASSYAFRKTGNRSEDGQEEFSPKTTKQHSLSDKGKRMRVSLMIQLHHSLPLLAQNGSMATKKSGHVLQCFTTCCCGGQFLWMNRSE